jgi:hypothetical protein
MYRLGLVGTIVIWLGLVEVLRGSLTAGSCNLYYYCGNVSLILYDTLRDNLGCSYEQTSLPVGDNRGCCPPGYYCNATPEAVASGDVTCTQYSWICSDFTDDGQPECEAHPGCFWVSTGVASEDYCTDDLSGLGCSVYKSETYCRNDDMELGVLGYGTDSCRDENIPIKCEGKSFVLDGCQCQWNTADGTCELIQRISSDFYNESTNYTFTCNKLFGMGDCLEGEQKVNWTARMVDISTGSPIPATATMMECIKNATGCRDGATTRFCGEEVVKLPGFSLFALLTSIVVIGLFYIFKKDL